MLKKKRKALPPGTKANVPTYASSSWKTSSSRLARRPCCRNRRASASCSTQRPTSSTASALRSFCRRLRTNRNEDASKREIYYTQRFSVLLIVHGETTANLHSHICAGLKGDDRCVCTVHKRNPAHNIPSFLTT